MKTTHAVQEIADGVFAYLQQGSWGFSNAGFVRDRQGSLLVDTLYDLRLTERMLAELRRVVGAGARVATVVNTHANGDHCWGNQLVSDAKIISSRAAAQEMLELSPRKMHALVAASRAIVGLGPLAQKPLRLLERVGLSEASMLSDAASFLVQAFGGFDFGSVTLRLPDTTFDGHLRFSVGDKPVELLEVGPAHTRGDAIAFLPEQRVVFVGDIQFEGSHPIAWDGPVENCIAACDTILALDVDVVVPGHGPLTDCAGVQRTKAYWERVQQLAREVHTQGLAAEQAVATLLREYDLRESERAVANIEGALRWLRGAKRPASPLAMLARMARHARAA